ncbi:hypothetical protein BV22DRAFT_1052206 [Leucogyrophana mollusca]|uniref:Uncharacterized protein n=1 Tax=Leucogyrophana mollusca TaxID=85980 RepID=A0ACB8AWK7_9AGAM|nr:hypothetical protein BV22DRAFT_1052206 [Leucogyrophana mollusca]
MDANFRLKNRMRSSDAADPGLHTGLAYFVPEAPYKAHLLKFASQKDMSDISTISTCSGFKTLAHAESKFSTGLRATGVGLCLCARHKFVQANGVGDLQKGERYCNTDYVFFSALALLLLLSVIVSYDIACQWKVNLWERMNRLPDELQVPLALAAAGFLFGIPKFHCPAHSLLCGIPHSLNLMPGVGRTDGEGSRHDTLDDHFGHHNWRKYMMMDAVPLTMNAGTSLRTKLLVALLKRDCQQGALEEFNAAIGANLREEWTSMITAWEKDKSWANPYVNVKHNLVEIHSKKYAIRLIAAERRFERENARERENDLRRRNETLTLREKWNLICSKHTYEHEAHQALNDEWAKARARAHRWTEEAMLLKEEMQRVRVYLNWRAKWWATRTAVRVQDNILAEAIQRGLLARFTYLWENVDVRVESSTAWMDVDAEGLVTQAALEEANEDKEGEDDEDDNL